MVNRVVEVIEGVTPFPSRPPLSPRAVGISCAILGMVVIRKFVLPLVHAVHFLLDVQREMMQSER